ncbi:MAG: TolC family protein, partial [Phycisphaerae bacterium]|nr:TolC family protein [Phycisphaerae bacterium]
MTPSQPSMARRSLVSLGTALVLAACTTAPPYQPPRMPELAGFTAAAPPTTTTTTTTTTTVTADGPLGRAQQFVNGPVEAAWWRTLRSPALDTLVDEALRASPTLAAAEAVLVQARELFAAQRGSTQVPQVDLGLGAQHQQISPASQGLPGEPRAFELYNASVSVRYRFDFGGSTDSSLRAFAARADIRQHELSAARH